jgi:deazaflavin-dependent oxidoreductase (nitroreductase family)
MKRFHKNLSRRLIDALVAASIRRGMGPSYNYLLTVTGRATKAPHTTPVSLVIDGPSRYLVAPYGETAWVRNARAARSVTLSRGRRSESCAIAELQPAEAGPILRRYLKLAPITRPYFDVGPEAPDDAFVAEAAAHPVFRLTPKAS